MERDFSKRYGFHERPAKMLREGDSDALRAFVLRHVSREARGRIHETRDMVSGVLNYVPDVSNRSVEQIWWEIQNEVIRCEWYLLYNLIEELYRVRSVFSDYNKDAFLADVNQFFYDQNIGWQLRVVDSANISALN